MPQIDVKSQVEELSVESFETFCEDIAGMFGVDMQTTAQEVSVETSKGLARKYKKLAALFTIQTSGALNGHFHIVVDKEGLFTLAGTIVMLPEKRILDMRRKGTQKDAEELDDAVGETGNLLVGSWDRVFREGWESHGHFLQSATFIGLPWDDAQANLGVGDDEEFTYIPFEMSVGEFPAFNCGVIFPESIFVEKPASEEAVEATPEESADVTEEVETAQETVQEVIPAEEEVPPADPPEEEATQTKSQPDDEVTPEPQPVAEDPKTEEPEIEEPETTEEPETEEADVQESVEAEQSQPESTEDEELPVVAEDDTEPASQEETSQDIDATEEPAAVEPIEAPQEVKGVVAQSIEKMVNSSASLPGQEVGPFLNLCAKDIMQTSVTWASPDDSVQQALTKMQETDSGYLMVGTNGVLEGIISWVDLIGAISIYLKPIFAKWRRPADDATLQIRLKVIMTRPVRTAKSDTTLAVIMENMCQHGLRCLPIIDTQGGVQGVVTAFDLFKAMLNTNTDIATIGQAPQGGLV